MIAKDGNFENLKVNTDGNIWGREGVVPTTDRQLTNKQYVDSRTEDATVSQKGIAKLGKVAHGTSVPSLEQGQMFYNTSTKVLLIKS